MTIGSLCLPFRQLRDRASDRCLPCLSDPERRSSLGLKLALVLVHVVFVGSLFLLDGDFVEKTVTEPWWKDMISIVLLCGLLIILIFLLLLLLFHSYLILTNQTTYELVRRRRIPYLRGIPEKVYPFSKGICQNIHRFCCARGSEYYVERLPTLQELGELARPYTCLDMLTCRCC